MITRFCVADRTGGKIEPFADGLEDLSNRDF
jgi:hypothetical protein